jgi:two-component system sensor histidine kinase PilS (NtrC family)
MDSSHLQQIVWNLTTNALKYGQKEGQELRIVLRGGYTEDSRGAYLDVIDFGESLDPEIAQKMFEPFYTTSTGGTGLGLYITRELCECNRVTLSYIPKTAGGSCFRLFFSKSTRFEL